MPELTVNQDALKDVIITVKLQVNARLYEKGAITEEMFIKAKEMILMD